MIQPDPDGLVGRSDHFAVGVGQAALRSVSPSVIDVTRQEKSEPVNSASLQIDADGQKETSAANARMNPEDSMETMALCLSISLRLFV